jgi:GNAT superfamily N-acetyltransferase
VGGVTVRRGKVADARAIAAVRVASWRWAYRGLLPDDLLDGLSVDESEAGWATALRESAVHVCVALRDDAVVGFASTAASRDDDALLGTGEVLTLYVTRDEAGEGTGRALLAAVQEDLRSRGFERATLWVLEANARGRAFYERQGWAWDGARGDHQVQCANRPIVRYATQL